MNYPSGINQNEAPWNRPNVLGWDVQYKANGGWTLFKQYFNEEEAFWKAEVLAEGLKVRVISPENDTVWTGGL